MYHAKLKSKLSTTCSKNNVWLLKVRIRGYSDWVEDFPGSGNFTSSPLEFGVFQGLPLGTL